MGFWIFMLIMDLLLPFTMIGFGRYFMKKAPKEINSVFGYRTSMSMKNKDTWEFAHKYCGKKLNDNFEFCNSKCENCYEKMVDKDSHKIKYFILGIILGFLVMFYGIISNNNVFIIGIGIIVMGIDVVLLPFTTPETINFLGYQKSKFAGRISDILLIVVGVWMCFIQ